MADDDGDCMEGEPKCGYFEQTLKPISCRNGYLCLEQHVSAARVGMAVSNEQVAVLVLDPKTGRTANLSELVKDSNREGFLAAVNDAVASLQQSEGVYESEEPPRPYVAADAPEMLHLRKGDALVCEVSDATIASAATNAATNAHRYAPRQSDFSICDFGGTHVV